MLVGTHPEAGRWMRDDPAARAAWLLKLAWQRGGAFILTHLQPTLHVG
jgi:hypothetical protein